MVSDEGVTPVPGQPGSGRACELTAEWALWGKRAGDTVYHVLECSAGTLTTWDFADIVRRYAPGTADRLPQYTVGWVPGADGAPEFVAAAVHEHAPYGPRSAGRSRYDADGREIVFVRLFCVRYADLAEYGVSYAELLDAVQRQELPPRAAATPGPAGPEGEPGSPARTAPVTIRISSQPQPRPQPGTGCGEELAEEVAVLLLTAAQVCVLGADEVPAADRLAFVDSALSLLPYGLRATLSASTWASSTAQDLKLRLFFADAPRDDGRTRHVRWGQPGPPGSLAPDSEVARLYLDWLSRAGSQARSLLAGQKAPRRFADTDLRQMLAALPRDLTVTDALEDLAASLSAKDSTATRAETQRLRGYLDRPPGTAERDRHRRQVLDHGLLKDHPRLHQSDKASVYRTLLSLAFETPLSYAGYCEIEDSLGGPPRGTLRDVMLRLSYASFLPWLLVARSDPKVTDEELVETLAGEGMPADSLLMSLEREFDGMRPAHRGVLYDLGMRYLRAYAEDPGAELARHGYLAGTLEAVFPDDQHAQRIRLEETLRFACGEQLSRGQIRELFANPDVRPTAALEAAATRLASSASAGTFIAQQARLARFRYAGDADEPWSARRTRRWRPATRRHHGPFPADPGRQPGHSETPWPRGCDARFARCSREEVSSLPLG